MAHPIDTVWFADPVPSPVLKASNEFRSYLTRRAESTVQLSGSEVDDIELVGDFVVLTAGTCKRAVPLSNVVTFEPPPPRRGRPVKKEPSSAEKAFTKNVAAKKANGLGAKLMEDFVGS